jgi:hypothetical protein
VCSAGLIASPFAVGVSKPCRRRASFALAAARRAPAVAGVDVCPHCDRVLALMPFLPSAKPCRLPLAAGSHRKSRRPSSSGARAAAVADFDFGQGSRPHRSVAGAGPVSVEKGVGPFEY